MGIRLTKNQQALLSYIEDVGICSLRSIISSVRLIGGDVKDELEGLLKEGLIRQENVYFFPTDKGIAFMEEQRR